jgi:hypothetical protein
MNDGQQDPSAVDKFCTDMETTPVGVIVGLFQAISQKLPAFADWDSQKHHHILNSNADVCNTMTEVRQHVSKYGEFTLKIPVVVMFCVTANPSSYLSRVLSSRSLQVDDI